MRETIKHSSKDFRNWDLIANCAPARLYKKGEMVYLQGQQANFFYFLKKGRIKIFLNSGSGTEKTLLMLEPSNIFGEAAFFDGLPRVSSAKALTDAQVVAISKPILTELFQKHPDVAFQILNYLSHTVRTLSAQVDHLTFLQADKRIAQILIRLCGGRQNHNLVTSQEDVANLVGTSRVTVNRILAQFSAKGWLKLQYRSIQITNLTALEQFAQSE